jgi:hypothetical protein
MDASDPVSVSDPPLPTEAGNAVEPPLSPLSPRFAAVARSVVGVVGVAGS